MEMAGYTNGFNAGQVEQKNKIIESTFTRYENPAKLESVLLSRLPLSTNVYNAVKLCQKWGAEIECYVYGWNVPAEAWIVVKCYRGDFGQELCISRPQHAPISPKIRELFKTSGIINWDEAFVIAAVDTEISMMMSDISIRDYGNCTHVHPCYLYYMDVKDALALQPSLRDSDVATEGPLTVEEGTEFLMNTWKYAGKGSRSHIEKCLRLNCSGGVRVKGKTVSGTAFVTHGLIGMLYTLTEARGKGYARVSMHSVARSLAEESMIPACTVEIRNEVSKAFQRKIGFKQGPTVDFVCFDNNGFD